MSQTFVKLFTMYAKLSNSTQRHKNTIFQKKKNLSKLTGFSMILTAQKYYKYTAIKCLGIVNVFFKRFKTFEVDVMSIIDKTIKMKDKTCPHLRNYN